MMSYTTQSSDEWLQFRPPLMTSGGLSDPIEETTELRGKTMSSPENSCTNYGDSNVQHTITKPTGRRSRASRKTPAIVLNANTKNFRALVQQFTGCQSSSSSFKGPINLNFGGGSEENYDIGRDQSTYMLRYDDFYQNTWADQDQHQHRQQLEQLQQVYEDDQEYDDFYQNTRADQDQDQHQQQLEQLQQVYEDDQERVFFCGSYDGDASLEISGNPATYSTTIDNMAEENAFLHHLPGDCSSNGLTDDEFFF